MLGGNGQVIIAALNKKIIIFLLSCFCFIDCLYSDAYAITKAKYAAQATRIFLSHDYFLKHKASKFWRLIPYYISQQSDAACSVAVVTMIINAVRASQNLSAMDELATQTNVLNQTNNLVWKKAVEPSGDGVTLDQLGKYTTQALHAFGIKSVQIQVIHADSPMFRRQVHHLLLQNEHSNYDFIIANFLQSVYTGDAAVGHMAPVAAYDAEKQQVLILDPDRQWYEPYWVSEDTFIKGMATMDMSSKKMRGLIWLHVS